MITDLDEAPGNKFLFKNLPSTYKVCLEECLLVSVEIHGHREGWNFDANLCCFL